MTGGSPATSSPGGPARRPRAARWHERADAAPRWPTPGVDLLFGVRRTQEGSGGPGAGTTGCVTAWIKCTVTEFAPKPFPVPRELRPCYGPVRSLLCACYFSALPGAAGPSPSTANRRIPLFPAPDRPAGQPPARLPDRMFSLFRPVPAVRTTARPPSRPAPPPSTSPPPGSNPARKTEPGGTPAKDPHWGATAGCAAPAAAVSVKRRTRTHPPNGHRPNPEGGCRRNDG